MTCTCFATELSFLCNFWKDVVVLVEDAALLVRNVRNPDEHNNKRMNMFKIRALLNQQSRRHYFGLL